MQFVPNILNLSFKLGTSIEKIKTTTIMTNYYSNWSL